MAKPNNPTQDIDKNQEKGEKPIIIIKSKLPFFQKLTYTAAFSQKANRLGIFTTEQLVTHLPSRYEDLSKISLIRDHPLGEAGQFEVMIKAVSSRGFGKKKSYSLQVTDGSADALIRFFNLYPAQINILQAGAQIRIYGELQQNGYNREFLHPRWKIAEKAPLLQNKLSPLYPLTAGLTHTAIANQISKTLVALPEEIIPAAISYNPRLANKLPSLKTALNNLHQPNAEITADEIEYLLSGENPNRKKLAFDELLALQILLRRLREKIKTRNAQPLFANSSSNFANNALDQYQQKLLTSLPFQLTNAQNKVLGEINQDLEQSRPMARLLQGDVGSGKTIIALLACLRALANNSQAVIMAPTEILAEQHYQRFTQLLRPLGINVGWLSSSTSTKERNELARLVNQKLINLVVGTHALFEDTLQFPNLALAVIDEQHRFGVRQRLRLQEREGVNRDNNLAPHQLMMSATPIPRTLAMSHYSHLDLSTIDELPPARQSIRTRLINSKRRDEILLYLLKGINQGRQVYWVCPLIEESESLQLQTAEETYQKLIIDLPELAQKNKIGLLHGRMNSQEKNAIMAKFSNNEISLLIATTVIEVGVDVPNACYMVIENAERFGLAQLHQLRGRIGRGEHQSVCILLFQEPLSDVGKERLKVIYENSDGFVIAKEDLRIRGPGEIIGDKQSGLPTLRFANIINDYELLSLAREFAALMIREYPEHCKTLIEFWFSQVDNLYST